jgi:tripartite-type tricarboxylate transporter receptor subunit TctC
MQRLDLRSKAPIAVMAGFALSLALAAGIAGSAAAQPMPADARWPDRPLRMIVPLPAGSAVDVIARLIGQRLSARLGQPVIVENRAGASGAIGADVVAKAAPDGYTLGMATSTTHMTAPVLNAKLPYDPVKDFAPVAIVGVSPYVLVVNPKVAANNVAELIALAKAKPKTLSYSSVGNASQAHLAGELFASLAGVELNHIPYKTSTHAVIDLNEGRIDMQFGILGSSLALIREGKLRALAVTTPRRLEELPGVQTMIEAGLPGYDVSLLFAVVLPAGTPKPIVARLNREIGEFVATPEVRRVLAAQAIQTVSSTPDELRERIAREIELWRGIAQKAGIKPE